MEVVRVDMQVAVAADIVVTGRNVEVPAHYRVHIAEKLARLERYGSHVSRIVRYDVVLDHEKNPRQSKVCQRVEITGRGTGPTVRAEACGPDFRSVLDAAVGKLQETLRRSHDRRRVHHGRHQPTSVAAATAPLATAPLTAAVVTDPDPSPAPHPHRTLREQHGDATVAVGLWVPGDGRPPTEGPARPTPAG
jgi:ribosomal subunit interface protein